MTATDVKDAKLLGEGLHPDPFSVLGLHQSGNDTIIRVYMPDVEAVAAVCTETDSTLPLERVDANLDLFVAHLPADFGRDYWLRFEAGETTWTADDPYRFGPVLGSLDEYLIGEGSHRRLWQLLGANRRTHEGVDGVNFAVWAPNARRVSVIGDFNNWDGRRNCMRSRGVTGVWELFIPGLQDGDTYRYELVGPDGQLLPLKSDPLGFGSEHPPANASVVRDLRNYSWNDQQWCQRRQQLQRIDQPISIYEVHTGSWARIVDEDHRFLSYRELADKLVPYVLDLGFTHIELLPVSEFPFDGSWGYQPVGLYAPTIRHGTPDEFRHLIEACHDAGIGVLLDWVPGHFPQDSHGLSRFDGTNLYEHQDAREGYHPDWKTLIYNYGRREVANYLVANALYWIDEFHIDGLRIDAVASMLYRDYSRKAGEWIPNKYGGNENLEAIDFLRYVNNALGSSAITVAEESTAFPAVTGQADHGGLGFDYKWNMGWMNDTLSYLSKDPVHRKHHHHQMTFGMHYQYTEKFILPLSHDEVVHGKGSLMDRIPGNHQEKAATLRAYYAYMWAHPGKKLLFMGNEFAQTSEWNYKSSLDWHLLAYPEHKGVQDLVRDLNRIYRSQPALYRYDDRPEGFRWVEAESADESLFAWIRFGEQADPQVLFVCNFTPVARSARRIAVPTAGRWREILNTDSSLYGGGGNGNQGGVVSEPVPASGFDHSVSITIPGLSALIFVSDLT